jgi:hypothetical protein
MSPAWAAVIVSIVVGLVGLYLGNSVRRQARATRETEAVEKRFEIYATLWKKMDVAAPMTQRIDGKPFPESQRRTLYNDLTTWFFDYAGGMVLGEPARTIYLRAKENLGVEDLEKLYPSAVSECVCAASDSEEARRRIVVRQLSLLRTAMKADLGIFGRVYGPSLSDVDKDFLRNCGAALWRRPWWSRKGPWWRDDWHTRAAEWWRRWDKREKPPADPDPCAPPQVTVIPPTST